MNLPCMALYCIGVTCSNPGGGTSQYLYGFFFGFTRSPDGLKKRFQLHYDVPSKSNISCYACSTKWYHNLRIMRSLATFKSPRQHLITMQVHTIRYVLNATYPAEILNACGHIGT